MDITQSNSSEGLSAEILAEARRECDGIVRHAQNEAATLLATGKAEADKICREKQESAKAEAARRTKMALATIPVEARQYHSKRIESILESIRAEAGHRLKESRSDCHETVVVLSSEAIRQMAGMNFLLKISPADHAALGNRLADEITLRIDRPALQLTFSPDPSMTEGDVMVQDAEGSQVWDNRLSSRLERMWPELRRQIAIQISLVEQNKPSNNSTISGVENTTANPAHSRQSSDMRQASGALNVFSSPSSDCLEPKTGDPK